MNGTRCADDYIMEVVGRERRRAFGCEKCRSRTGNEKKRKGPVGFKFAWVAMLVGRFDEG